MSPSSINKIKDIHLAVLHVTDLFASRFLFASRSRPFFAVEDDPPATACTGRSGGRLRAGDGGLIEFDDTAKGNDVVLELVAEHAGEEIRGAIDAAGESAGELVDGPGSAPREIGEFFETDRAGGVVI